MTWNPPLFPDKEENKSANQTEDTMSNSRIQSKALNAKLSWEIIGLDLAKNDLSFVGITLATSNQLNSPETPIQRLLPWNRVVSHII